MSNAINWFEIPASDLSSSVNFYEKVLAIKMLPMDSPQRKMAAFPADWSKGEVAGAVVQADDLKPSGEGALLFLNGGQDLGPVLARVSAAGGKVVVPKTKIPMGDAGYMAIIEDVAGNRVGLHSMS